jgi:glycosyltransferase involved in cell wall biosynthesis
MDLLLSFTSLDVTTAAGKALNQEAGTSHGAGAGASIKVLMFAPEPSLDGGVVVFTDTLKRRLGSGIDTDTFVIGRRPGVAGKALRLLRPLIDTFRLAGILLTKRHDIYHLNPSLVPRAVFRDGLFLILLRLFRRQRVLVSIHGWDWDFFQRMTESPVQRTFFRIAFGYAEKILVLGSTFASALEPLRLGQGKVTCFTTMFDEGLFKGVSRARADQAIHILFLGRFIPVKGIFELLEAFHRISKDRQDLILVMAGHSDEVPRAKEWCAERGLEDRVIFPGYVSGDEKGQLLLDSDIFVLPSYHGEGCPIALLEAMGAGLAVITTPVGGVPDIIQDGLNGLFIQPKNVDAIEEALRRLIDDPGLRARIAQYNREDAVANYEARAVARRLEEQYSDLYRREGKFAKPRAAG